MKLREAHRLAKEARINTERKIALVCSFEPLHLRTFLQAYVVARSDDAAPTVVTFGYDSLAHALQETSTTLAASPALLVLTWEDLHPALSWRTRAHFGAVSAEDVQGTSAQLFERLRRWVTARAGAVTCVATPPLAWLPWLDPEPAPVLGRIRATATALLAQHAAELQQLGARILPLPDVELSLRDLLRAGSPVSAEGADRIARIWADLAFPEIERKKVVVLDGDGTLWRGVLGEVGVEGIECGEEGEGRGYATFQNFLLKLKRDGMILALCSKNDPADVENVFRTKGMPLSWDDFAAHRVSWDSKTDHLRSLADELNLGLDSFVFVDDNEAEIALVEYELPEVTTIVASKDASGWTQVFAQLQRLCATWQVTRDDLTRTQMLRARRSASMQPQTASLSTWAHLSDFELRVAFNDEAFEDDRSLQLVNKTNQFNLTGERIDPEDWLSLSRSTTAFCCSTRLADRFGDFGTIAVVVGERDSDTALTLRQFVLSCRAFGRGVEHMTLLHVLDLLRPEVVVVPYRDTGRNEPARRFLESIASPSGPGSYTISQEALGAAVATLVEEARPVVTR